MSSLYPYATTARRARKWLSALVVLVCAMLTTAGMAWAAPPPSSSSSPVHPSLNREVAPALAGHAHANVCGSPLPHAAACNAVKDLNISGNLAPSAIPAGYAPSDLTSAYNLPSPGSNIGGLVAVVTAFDNPAAEQDLAVYRAKYGLPSCGAGCFRKVDQNGGQPTQP